MIVFVLMSYGSCFPSDGAGTTSTSCTRSFDRLTASSVTRPAFTFVVSVLITMPELEGSTLGSCSVMLTICVVAACAMGESVAGDSATANKVVTRGLTIIALPAFDLYPKSFGAALLDCQKPTV